VLRGACLLLELLIWLRKQWELPIMKHQQAGNSLEIFLIKILFKFAEKKALVQVALISVRRTESGLFYAGYKF